ncbi:MAG TPA: cyclic nucleotide-binding domain-containing protein [Pyrinomonadaceae bacterium]|nr:cyclic nucleotide-binding domain-containing protein [Pyrinomonadaceae bacterium]
MPKVDTTPEAILEAVKKIDIVSELLDEKNKNNLKMIVEGKVSGGKQIGPYARLLTYDAGEVIMAEGEWGGNTFYLSVTGDLDVFVKDESGAHKKVARIPPGACLGERSVLAGIPRNATIKVPQDGGAATVLEMVRPALRLLRSLKKFAEKVDDSYRNHGLANAIGKLQEETGSALTPLDLVSLGNISQFMAYGKHHLLVQEGMPIDRIFLIRSGWVRRVRGVPIYADITESTAPGSLVPEDFLGSGNCLGLEALQGQKTWAYSAALMQRTELLEIPLASLQAEPELCQRLGKAFGALSQADDDTGLTAQQNGRQLAAAEKEIATGIVDGVNLLVMDMDLCVRCGNCSLACHKVHGQSRLLRRGIHIQRPVDLKSNREQHVLVPSVCMHCKDPECLTGCPTGAIFRDLGGQVDINPVTCIGCFDCATQCPYNAISMVPRDGEPVVAGGLMTRLRMLFGSSAPPVAVLEVEAKPESGTVPAVGAATAPQAAPKPAAKPEDDMVAIKCNLCEHTPLNPEGAKRPAYSCEENCPTGALVRVNPQEYFDEVEKTLGLVFRDQTHAIGRNIHKSDPKAKAWHVIGGLLVLALSALMGWMAWRYGFNESLRGGWLTMRWLTGLVGLGGIAIVMTYPLRKTIYRRRAGALRYWLLAHLYFGALAGIVLLMHGGSHGGGILTMTLMIAFDVVILTGLFGLAAYFIAPRILTSIEGEPLLIEDLEARRAELSQEITDITGKAEGNARELIERKMRGHFFSLGYLLRQYTRREALTASLAQGRLKFRNELAAIEDKAQRTAALKALERMATLRRVDTLIYLHRLLKIWVAPHVVSTSVMLVLMIAHIVQAVFFNVR